MSEHRLEVEARALDLHIADYEERIANLRELLRVQSRELTAAEEVQGVFAGTPFIGAWKTMCALRERMVTDAKEGIARLELELSPLKAHRKSINVNVAKVLDVDDVGLHSAIMRFSGATHTAQVSEPPFPSAHFRLAIPVRFMAVNMEAYTMPVTALANHLDVQMRRLRWTTPFLGVFDLHLAFVPEFDTLYYAWTDDIYRAGGRIAW